MRIFKKFLASLIPTPKTGQVTLFIDSADNKLTRKEANETLSKYVTDAEGGAPIIDVTYDELITLRDVDELIPGQQYQITDYRTVHVIPGTLDINTGPIEPLIVTANSPSNLDIIAVSQNYPQDIIYYKWGTDEDNFPGATHGYITRRIDTDRNNNIATDWRHVKYRRYKISHQVDYNPATVYPKHAVVTRTTGLRVNQKELYVSLRDGNQGVAVNDGHWWRRFEFNNDEYAALTPTIWGLCYDKQNGDHLIKVNTTTEFQDKTFFGTYSANNYNNFINEFRLFNSVCVAKTTSDFYNNNITNDFYNNSIKTFRNNTITGGFFNNSIGSGFINNVLNWSFYENSISVKFSENVLDGHVFANSIGSDFYNNHIYYIFAGNIVAQLFSRNTILNGSVNNTFGNFFGFNTIHGEFSENKFGLSVFDNSLAKFSNNEVGNDFQSNTFRTSFTGGLIKENVIENTFDQYSRDGITIENTIKNTHNGIKVYKALLTQSGTNDPVATVLENTLGGEVVWTRESSGKYATNVGLFPQNRTLVFMSRINEMGSRSNAWYAYEDAVVIIESYKADNTTTDDNLLSDVDGFNKTTILIEVYP